MSDLQKSVPRGGMSASGSISVDRANSNNSQISKLPMDRIRPGSASASASAMPSGREGHHSAVTSSRYGRTDVLDATGRQELMYSPCPEI